MVQLSLQNFVVTTPTGEDYKIPDASFTFVDGCQEPPYKCEIILTDGSVLSIEVAPQSPEDADGYYAISIGGCPKQCTLWQELSVDKVSDSFSFVFLDVSGEERISSSNLRGWTVKGLVGFSMPISI